MVLDGFVVLLTWFDIILDFLHDAEVSGVEFVVGKGVEEIGVFGRLLDDFHPHKGIGVLEFDGEVGEGFVLVVADAHGLPVLPKLLGYPVGDVRYRAEVHQVAFHIDDLLAEESAQVQLPPSRPVLIHVDQGQFQYFGDRLICVLAQLYRLVLSQFLNLDEGILDGVIDEGMDPEVEEIEEAACRPHIALGGIGLVHELLWG